MRSFLEVPFFWSFRGWNLIFSSSLFMRLKMQIVNLFFYALEIFLRESRLPGANWNSISKQKIFHIDGFWYRRFSVFHKKICFHTMILALYQAYSKISFRDFYQVDNFFSQNSSFQKKLFLTKLQRKYAWWRDFLHFFTFEKSEMAISSIKKVKSDNCFFFVIIFFFCEKRKSFGKKKTIITKKKQLSTF